MYSHGLQKAQRVLGKDFAPDDELVKQFQASLSFQVDIDDGAADNASASSSPTSVGPAAKRRSPATGKEIKLRIGTEISAASTFHALPRAPPAAVTDPQLLFSLGAEGPPSLLPALAALCLQAVAAAVVRWTGAAREQQHAALHAEAVGALPPHLRDRLRHTLSCRCALTDWALPPLLTPLTRTLDLSLCAQLSDAALRAVAARCPLLEQLDLRNCSRVTDAGLLAVLAPTDSLLVVLDISGLPLLTDRSVDALVAFRNPLRLRFGGNHGLSARGLDQLQNRRHELGLPVPRAAARRGAPALSRPPPPAAAAAAPQS